MEYFYCPNLQMTSQSVDLSPEESHHLKRVFRKQRGEKITLVNGKGGKAIAAIASESKKQVSCQVINYQNISPLPGRNIHIAMALIRPNRLDWAVEKLTELGIGSISLLKTQFTQVKAFKQAHLEKIMISAMKQSKQVFMPALHAPVSFPAYLQTLSDTMPDGRFIAHLGNSAKPVSQLLSGTNFLQTHILIGPEGGFSTDEIALCAQHNFAKITLGPTILRAETAAIFAAAAIILEYNFINRK